MKSRRLEFWVLVTLMAVFALGIISAAGWPSAPRLYAQIFAIPGLILAGISLVSLVMAAGRSTKEAGNEAQVSFRKEVAFFVWMIGFVVATRLFGFVIAVVSFVLCYLLANGQKLLPSIGLTASVAVIVVYVFGRLFQVNWIDGIVWFWLGF